MMWFFSTCCRSCILLAVQYWATKVWSCWNLAGDFKNHQPCWGKPHIINSSPSTYALIYSKLWSYYSLRLINYDFVYKLIKRVYWAKGVVNLLLTIFSCPWILHTRNKCYGILLHLVFDTHVYHLQICKPSLLWFHEFFHAILTK